MIIDITSETLPLIKNPAFAAAAKTYIDIYQDYMSQVRALGIVVASHDDQDEIEAKRQQLSVRGAIFRNAGKSIYINDISPACIVCRDGVGSETFFVSLKCHRNCYFCFNPNQENYEYYLHHERDIQQELDAVYSNGNRLTHLAVTGGEPLLHKSEIFGFFAHADQQYPDIYKRLYTSGDHADDQTLQALHDSGLEEIRFSIRLDDLRKGQRYTFDRIRRAMDFVPSVMVEMPVLPDTQDEMEDILIELDEIGISNINLLEFCYPLTDPEPFNQRGFKIKPRPYRVLYDYWYASGLPIAGSELACLDLLDFALDRELKMGIHYCSLENKFTAQLFKQNAGQSVPRHMHFSEQDFFFKSAKAFGGDIPSVVERFRENDIDCFVTNVSNDEIEFHVDDIPVLTGMGLEVGISTQTVEERDNRRYLRELKIDLTYPEQFTGF